MLSLVLQIQVSRRKVWKRVCIGGKMGRERACTYIEASGGGRQETEEPPWLLAVVYFGLQ